MRLHFRDFSCEKGFVLAIVLIVLLILALVTTALLNNQSVAVREMRDMLTAEQHRQDTHNLHRACLTVIRTDMSYLSLESGRSIDWQEPFVPDGMQGRCWVELAEMPVNTIWVPRFKIISSTLDGQMQVSEWRYAACVPNASASSCFTALSTLKVRNSTSQLTPQFLKNAMVQTAWRQQ